MDTTTTQTTSTEAPQTTATPTTPAPSPATPTTLLSQSATPPAQTPGTQQQSAPPAWTTADGKFADGWLDRLPPELADAKPTLAKYQDLHSLAKAHHSLQRMLGAKANALLPITDKSTPEEIAAWRKATGVPDDPKGYNLKPEKIPDGIDWNDDIMARYAEVAHKHNIPAAAMRELTQAHLATEAQRAQEYIRQANESIKAAVGTLREAWGQDFDNQIALAQRTAKTVGFDIKSPAANDPEVVKAFARLGAMMSEDKLVSGGSATTQGGAMRAKAIQTGSDPSVRHLHELYVKGDPATVAQVRDLLKNG